MKNRGPLIQMRDAQIKDVVDEAEDVLIVTTEGPQIFQRGQELVRVTRLDEVCDAHGVRRAAGAMVVTPITPTWLKERLDTVADWRAWRTVKGKGDGWVPTSPKVEFVQTLLDRKAWRFPVIHGITTCPTLAADGRIVEEPGFDEGTGLYLDFKAGDFPPIPLTPSLEEAKAALALFANPLRKMPWANPESRSVAMSAGLTAMIRGSIRTAPLHGFDAPTMATGKSLCCDWVGLIKTGQTPPAMSQGKSAEEDEKRLSAVLYAGDTMILIDNCALPIEGDFLCSMLTQQVVQARILGETRKVVLPSTALVLASGNNITTRGDMTRRVVICRLDAHCERPDERKFDFDVKEETLAQRPQLVVAGLTVLRAYSAASRPLKDNLRGMGSFEDWAWIREALVWCGEADPLISRDELMASDQMKSELVDIMDTWEAAVGTKTIGVEAVRDLGDKGMALEQKLVEVTGKREWNGSSVGWWLRKHKDRMVGGRAFRAVSGRTMKWKLEGADGEAEGEKVPF